MKKSPPVPAIVASNVSKTFSKGKTAVHALRGVTLSVAPGEVVGLIGPNGAGKSTFLRILLGFLPSDHGSSVSLFGHDPEDLTVRSFSGYQGDSSYRSKQVSVRRFLELHARLAGTYIDGQVDAFLKEFSMTDAADRGLSALSKGMRQKVELMTAFVGRPKVVFLDEPTGSLDPPSVFELRQFIIGQRKKGVTILFSSHNLTEVEEACSRVFFIDNGKLVAEYDMKKRRPKGFLEKAFRKHLTLRKERS
jgi:ABC-2 type transport system ATP-binding protein